METKNNTQHVCMQIGAIAKLESNVQAILKRMDEQNQLKNSINELKLEYNISTTKMLGQLDAIVTMQKKQNKDIEADINEIDERLKAVEAKPLKTYDAIKDKIIAAIISCIIGAGLGIVGMMIANTIKG